MSRAHAYTNTKAEEYARWRRRDHANIEAMRNLVISAIAAESGVEMPPHVRALISALQGAHGGGEVAFEPFERDYLSIGAQLQFTGTDEAIRQRVRSWVNDLLEWQEKTLIELYSVVKGGKKISTRGDGSPIRQKTRFIDNLKPHADEAVQRARAAELWRGNKEKGIKAHPGKALAAEVEWLRKQLPRLEPKPKGEDGGESEKAGRVVPLERYERERAVTKAIKDSAAAIRARSGDAAMWLGRIGEMVVEARETEKREPSAGSVVEFERRREAAIINALEDAADGIEAREGDADLWLEKLEKRIRKMRDSRRKTQRARR